jgi:ketosteroid isomerase-like protein
MRKITPIMLALLVSGHLIAFAADADDPILTAEKSWAKSVMAMDIKALEEIYSDDLIYAHSTGVTETKREYLDKLKQGTQKYTLIEHQSTQTKMFGDSAIAHSTVRMKGTSATGSFDSKLMMIHVWVMQGGKWKLVAHQTTKLMDY